MQHSAEEKNLNERARFALAAANGETNETLKAALMARVRRLQEKSLSLQLARKQQTLDGLGIPRSI